MMWTITLIFILGYFLIALENQTGVNKTAVALVLGMTLWTLCVFAGPNTIILANSNSFQEFLHNTPSLTISSPFQQTMQYITSVQIIDHLGNIAEILFYLLGAMTIVEWMNTHKSFNLITQKITTRNKRKLLWLIAGITFFMSSILDNLTTAIVMVMLLRLLLTDQRERWIFGSMIIVAANAGGAWTPIGDVTTIMLWIHDNITSLNIIRHLILPSLTSLVIPLTIATFWLHGDTKPTYTDETNNTLAITRGEQLTILILGISSFLFVPLFKELTGLPPFMGIMLALGVLWIYTEILYNRKKNIAPDKIHRVTFILTKIDYSTLLFFLGILMAVAALQVSGILNQMATFLNDKLHNVYFINTIIGLLSSIIDNVPLVAAAMGMYPLTHVDRVSLSPYLMNFTTDGTFWELLAYSAGIGGSILIIGSAAGVVVMGLERINFMWYMKHISWIVLLGYLAGIGVYYFQSLI